MKHFVIENRHKAKVFSLISDFVRNRFVPIKKKQTCCALKIEHEAAEAMGKIGPV